ncbi:hypothetical protein LX32DRAFT_93388 [Colletotrichum zoysiae]|uniref:Uncharacterized protein n=1 Tax=Colletotrichum zoysiae TaxID=1216348 RepID=A0AAD9HB20_9PEZI|nr:hypothetical protein LX32DRAFT_93388 [Colletotrichum zoysiae]
MEGGRDTDLQSSDGSCGPPASGTRLKYYEIEKKRKEEKAHGLVTHAPRIYPPPHVVQRTYRTPHDSLFLVCLEKRRTSFLVLFIFHKQSKAKRSKAKQWKAGWLAGWFQAAAVGGAVPHAKHFFWGFSSWRLFVEKTNQQTREEKMFDVSQVKSSQSGWGGTGQDRIG